MSEQDTVSDAQIQAAIEIFTADEGCFITASVMNEAATMLRELLALRQGWRDIASAPHGRTVLVAYRNQLGKWRRVRATFYEAGQLMCDDNTEPPYCDENGYALPGWYEECESAEYIQAVDGEPELWIDLPPLPAPPARGDG